MDFAMLMSDLDKMMSTIGKVAPKKPVERVLPRVIEDDGEEKRVVHNELKYDREYYEIMSQAIPSNHKVLHELLTGRLTKGCVVRLADHPTVPHNWMVGREYKVQDVYITGNNDPRVEFKIGIPIGQDKSTGKVRWTRKTLHGLAIAEIVKEAPAEEE